MSNERQQPHSAEAEEHVIGCCLLDEGESLNRAIDRGVQGSDFYFPSNRLIFETLIEMRVQKKGISLEVLASELQSSRQLEAVGGHAQLLRLRVDSTTHASYFIDQVKSKSQLRELIKVSESAVEQAYQANGDSSDLMERVKSDIEEVCRPASGQLKERAYDHQKIITKPKPIFTAAGTTVCTPGNLTTLYSPPKAGKSSLLGAMLAATYLQPGVTTFDTLGILGSNPKGHAVIHLDTEQSPYDWQQMIQTSLRRVDLDKPPSWLMSYSLTGMGAAECRRTLETLLRQGKKKFGGIHSVHIDGIGDMVADPNDSAECFPFIVNLHGLAIEYETAIINVLHLNPGSEEKGRGHLGSHLERKSESNLMLEKKDGISSYWGVKQRGKAIGKSEAPSFLWSEEKGMHVSCASPEMKQKSPGGRSRLHTIQEFWDMIPEKGKPGMTGTQLHRFALQVAEIKPNTFKDLLSSAVKDGLLLRFSDPKTGFSFTRAV